MYKLQKPYTEKDKLDFIVEYNHENGLRIEETSVAIYALEEKELLVDDEVIIDPNYEEMRVNSLREIRKNEIFEELGELDNKRIRAVCENSVKDENTGQTWLEYYNEKVSQLRSEYQELLGN